MGDNNTENLCDNKGDYVCIKSTLVSTIQQRFSDPHIFSLPGPHQSVHVLS